MTGFVEERGYLDHCFMIASVVVDVIEKSM